LLGIMLITFSFVNYFFPGNAPIFVLYSLVSILTVLEVILLDISVFIEIFQSSSRAQAD